MADELEDAAGGDEAELVLRAQRGDSRAFTVLVSRHGHALAAFCRRLMDQPATAQDLAQETLTRAYQSLARLDDPARFEAWLLGIAANLARWWWRGRSRRPLSLDYLTSGGRDLPVSDALSVAAPPHDVLEAADRARRLVAAIGALPLPLRHVLVLHYVEGQSYAEIAAALAVPVSTIKGRLFKSRSRLRAALDDVDAQPSRPRAPERRRRPRIPRSASAKGVTPVSARAEPGDSHPSAAARAAALVSARHQSLADWHSARAKGDPLSPSATRVFESAEAEARQLQRNFLGTEHVLLGLLEDDAGLSVRLLSASDVARDQVRETIASMVGRGDRPVTATPGFAPRVKMLLEEAVDEARQLGSESVAPEHLLLGVLAIGSGIGAIVLESLGIELTSLRTQVIEATGHTPPRRPWPEESSVVRWVRSLLPEGREIEFLRRAPILRELAVAAIVYLIDAGTPRVFAAGEHLVTEGTAPAAMHLLIRGHVEVRRGAVPAPPPPTPGTASSTELTAPAKSERTPPGSRMLSAPVGGVLPFGMLSVLSEDAAAPASVVARDVCEAVTITRDAFRSLAEAHPWIRLAVGEAVERHRQFVAEHQGSWRALLA